MPVGALFSDIGQRVVTLNKRDQRAFLASWLCRRGIVRGRVLDFGCGTGLFATTLRDAGLDYTGYDPDDANVRYAAWTYPDLPFTSRLGEVSGPFDLILANCCFHHIEDRELQEDVVPAVASRLAAGGTLLVIDALPLEPDATWRRRAFSLLELGARKRAGEEIERLLDGRFRVRERTVNRTYAFTLPGRGGSIYNDVVVLELVHRLPRSVEARRP